MLFLLLLFLADVEPILSQRLTGLPLPAVTESLLFLGRHWSWILLGAVGFVVLGICVKVVRKPAIQVPLFLCLVLGLAYCLIAFYLPLHASL